MSVARVVACRLYSMADGVTQVEDMAEPRVALISGDDRALVTSTGENDVIKVSGIQPLDHPHPVPERSTSQKTRLQRLDESGCKLLLWQAQQRLGIGNDGGGQVVSANIILALRKVDPSLATVGRINLRYQRRRQMDDWHASLVNVGTETRDISGDTAA